MVNTTSTSASLCSVGSFRFAAALARRLSNQPSIPDLLNFVHDLLDQLLNATNIYIELYSPRLLVGECRLEERNRSTSCTFPITLDGREFGVMVVACMPNCHLPLSDMALVETCLEEIAHRVCRRANDELKSGLSLTELRVLSLIHLSTREIAATLVVGDETVRSHIKHIYKKANIRTRGEAVALKERLFNGIG